MSFNYASMALFYNRPQLGITLPMIFLGPWGKFDFDSPECIGVIVGGLKSTCICRTSLTGSSPCATLSIEILWRHKEISTISSKIWKTRNITKLKNSEIYKIELASTSNLRKVKCSDSSSSWRQTCRKVRFSNSAWKASSVHAILIMKKKSLTLSWNSIPTKYKYLPRYQRRLICLPLANSGHTSP